MLEDLHAVSQIPGSKKDGKKLASLAWWSTLSCGLIFVQLLALSFVILEVSHPSCSSHSQCSVGDFCEDGIYWNVSKPNWNRCSDCVAKKWNFQGVQVDNSSCYFYLQTLDKWDSGLDYSKMLIGGFAASTYKTKYLARGMSRGRTNNATEKDKLRYYCSVDYHCKMTEIMPSRCDHLVLNLQRTNSSSLMLLVGFLAFVLAHPLSEDIEEANMEERVLVYVLDNFEDTQTLGTEDSDISSSLQTALVRICVGLIRIGFGMRKFILPFALTATAVLLLVSNDLTASNILLNLTAVAFIAEVDDFVSKFLGLRSEHFKKFENVNLQGLTIPAIIWIESRFQALACSGILLHTVIHFESIHELSQSSFDPGPSAPQNAQQAPCYLIHWALKNRVIYYPSAITWVITTMLQIGCCYWALKKEKKPPPKEPLVVQSDCAAVRKAKLREVWSNTSAKIVFAFLSMSFAISFIGVFLADILRPNFIKDKVKQYMSGPQSPTMWALALVCLMFSFQLQNEDKGRYTRVVGKISNSVLHTNHVVKLLVV